MSENKCPCCGCPMKETYLGFVCPADNCAFRCSTNSLPRIAAAMDARSRHAALVEAVAWERECRGFTYKHLTLAGHKELFLTSQAARTELDRLIANETADDCKDG